MSARRLQHILVSEMAPLQGANDVLAHHEKLLRSDQLSSMLLRQLKLANVRGYAIFVVTGSNLQSYLMPFQNPNQPSSSVKCGKYYHR
jgi:hypothetical protein